MAADASVNFDTRLDPSGFERGMDNIDKSFEGMKKTLADVAASSTSVFGSKSQLQIERMTKQWNRQSEAVENQRRKVEKLAEEYSTLEGNEFAAKESFESSSNEVVRLNGEIENLIKQYEVASQRAKEILPVDPGRLEELRQISDRAEAEYNSRIDSLRDQLSDLNVEIEDAQVRANDAAVSAATRRVELEQEIEEVKKRANEESVRDVEILRERIEEIEMQAAVAEAHLREVEGRNAEPIRELSGEIENVTRAWMDASDAYVRYRDSTAIAQQAAKVEMNEIAGEIDSVTENLYRAEEETQKLQEQFVEAQIKAQSFAGEIQAAADKTKRLEQEALSTGNALQDALNETPVVRFNRGLDLGRRAVAALGSAIRDMGRDTNRSTGAIERMLRRIMRLVTAVFVFNIIRRGLRGLQQYIFGLLQTNADFVESLNAIKVNLAVAFQPIFEAILPALNALMAALARVTAYLAAFISLLFGSSYARSKAAAAALNKEKEALKGVGGAAKEAGKELASFDQINKLTADNAGGGGGGGGGSFGDLIDSFEDPDLDLSWMDEFIKKLKELVPDLDYFENLGRGMAERIIRGLYGINWEWIQIWADSLGQKLGAFLSGSLAHPQLWAAIGYTLAQGLNTALMFLFALADTFNWKRFGQSFANGINRFFRTFNWGLAGRTMNVWARGLLSALIIAVRNIDWVLIGNSIKEFIINIDWRGIFVDLVELLRGVFKGIFDLLAAVLGQNAAATLIAVAGAITMVYVALQGWMIIDKLQSSWVMFTEMLTKIGSTTVLGALAVALGVGLALFVSFGDICPELTVVLGLLAGAFVAVGIAVSGIFGPFGWVIGIVAGLVTAFLSIKSALDKDVLPGLQRFSDAISDTTREALEPFVDKSVDVRQALIEMFIEGTPVVKENTLLIAGYFKDMADDAIASLEKMRDASIRNLAAIFGKEAVAYEESIARVNKKYDNMLDQSQRGIDRMEEEIELAKLSGKAQGDEYDALVAKHAESVAQHEILSNNIAEARQQELDVLREQGGEIIAEWERRRDSEIVHYEESQAIIEQAYEARMEELRAYLAQEGDLNSEHGRALLEMTQDYMFELIDMMEISDAEKLALKETYIQDSVQLTADEASKILQVAAKARDDEVSMAESKYSELMGAAQHMFDIGEISAKEYQAITAAAEANRKVETDTAYKKYMDLYNTTTSGMGDVSKEINVRTGKIQTDWQAGWDTIGGWMGGWWSDTAILAGTGGEEIGTDFTEGTYEALLAGSDDVEQSAYDMILNAINMVRDTQDSHSPSQVMYDEGMNFIKGMDNALVDGTKILVSTLQTMMQRLISVVSSAAPGFANQFRFMYNQILEYTERWVNNVFQGIGQMMKGLSDVATSVGGSMVVPTLGQVKIPRLAKGGLIPANNPMLVLMGDNRREEEIVSPRSAMREEFANALRDFAEGREGLFGGSSLFGGGQGVTVEAVLELDDTVIGRVLIPIIEAENQRKGVRIEVVGATG